MGRKNLLQDLMGAPETKSAEPARPRATKGAIGAVSKSIADLKSRSVTEIDPAKILAGGLMDRLEGEADADEALMASIRDHGQQVPVLVRPHPERADHFQIVYGRRRVAALRELGQPVRALVRDLDDKALIIAQGQENAARKDLSFIEKVNFARQMQDAGYDRKAMCAALHIDKTVISRMLMIADCVPVELIEAIGPANGVGRDRWLALANSLGSTEVDIDEAIDAAQMASDGGSDASFEAVLKTAEAVAAAPKTSPRRTSAAKSASRPAEMPLRGAGGAKLGSYAKTAKGLSMTLSGADGFDEWLVENMEQLHSDWTKES